MKKRIFAILVVAIMVITAFPVSAATPDLAMDNFGANIISTTEAEAPTGPQPRASSGIYAMEAWPGFSDGSYYPSLRCYTQATAALTLNLYVPTDIKNLIGGPSGGLYEGWWGNTTFATPSNAYKMNYYINDQLAGSQSCNGGQYYNVLWFCATPSSGSHILRITANTTSGTELIVGYAKILY